MKRQDLSKDDYSEDEERELAADAADAERYGFQKDAITTIRRDLCTFLFVHREVPLAHYENAAKEMERVVANLIESSSDLAAIAEQTDAADIAIAADSLRDIVSTIELIQADLPRRPKRIQGLALAYLISCWIHMPRKADYVGTREIVVSFNGPEPSHPSMRFILEMLARPNDSLLKGIGRSTIDRAWNKLAGNVPNPSEVHAFHGDPKYLS